MNISRIGRPIARAASARRSGPTNEQNSISVSTPGACCSGGAATSGANSRDAVVVHQPQPVRLELLERDAHAVVEALSAAAVARQAHVAHGQRRAPLERRDRLTRPVRRRVVDHENRRGRLRLPLKRPETAAENHLAVVGHDHRDDAHARRL
jgi:hypothetical protein